MSDAIITEIFGCFYSLLSPQSAYVPVGVRNVGSNLLLGFKHLIDAMNQFQPLYSSA